MSLPVKIDLFFAYNLMTGHMLSLPKSPYRTEKGAVKRAAHYNNDLGRLQTIYKWLEEDGRVNEYFHQLRMANEENKMGYELFPRLYKVTSPQAQEWNKKAVEGYKKVTMQPFSSGAEFEKLREIIYQTVAKRVDKGLSYDEKIDWNTQKVIQFFAYDNDKQTFVEV